jgi:hypothetical protein
MQSGNKAKPLVLQHGSRNGTANNQANAYF